MIENRDDEDGGAATGAAVPSPAEPTPAPFPIVGIGASAGGLAAFEAFFSGMPADRELGMAFVLVQHLAPDHRSMLVDLVQRFTRMDVRAVEDGVSDELRALSEGTVLDPHVTKRRDKAGATLAITLTSTALCDPTGKMYAIATTERRLPPTSGAA